MPLAKYLDEKPKAKIHHMSAIFFFFFFFFYFFFWVVQTQKREPFKLMASHSSTFLYFTCRFPEATHPTIKCKRKSATQTQRAKISSLRFPGNSTKPGAFWSIHSLNGNDTPCSLGKIPLPCSFQLNNYK